MCEPPDSSNLTPTEIASDVAGSLRLCGLQRSPQMQGLLAAWACGDATDADLREAERRVLAGQPLTGLPGTGQPPTPTRPGRPATPEEFEQFITDHAHLMLAPDGEG